MSINSMTSAKENTPSLAAFLGAADRLLCSNKQRLKVVEMELEQYGFSRPQETPALCGTAEELSNDDPLAAAAIAASGETEAAAEEGSAEAAPEDVAGEVAARTADATATLNSTFTMEGGEEEAPTATVAAAAAATAVAAHADATESVAAEESAVMAAADACVAPTPRKETASDTGADAAAGPHLSAKAIAPTPVRPPMAQDESTPKTPSLEDFGLSSTALAMLQNKSTCE